MFIHTRKVLVASFVVCLFICSAPGPAHAFYTHLGKKVAEKFYHSRDYKGAYDFINTHIQNNPDDWEGYLEMARWTIETDGLSKETFEWLDKADEKNPGYFVIDTWRGYTYALAGYREKAYQVLDDVVSREPSYAFATVIRAEAAYVFGDYDRLNDYINFGVEHVDQGYHAHLGTLRFFRLLALELPAEAESFLVSVIPADYETFIHMIVDYRVAYERYKEAAESNDYGVSYFYSKVYDANKANRSLNELYKDYNPRSFYVPNLYSGKMSTYSSKMGEFKRKQAYIYSILGDDDVIYAVTSSNSGYVEWPVMRMAGIRMGKMNDFKQRMKKEEMDRWVLEYTEKGEIPYTRWSFSLLYEVNGEPEMAEEYYLQGASKLPLNVLKEPARKGILGESELKPLRGIAQRAEQNLSYVNVSCQDSGITDGSFIGKFDGETGKLDLLRYVRDGDACRLYLYDTEYNRGNILEHIGEFELIDVDEGEMALGVFMPREWTGLYFFEDQVPDFYKIAEGEPVNEPRKQVELKEKAKPAADMPKYRKPAYIKGTLGELGISF